MSTISMYFMSPDDEIVGRIGFGLLVLLGIERNDTRYESRICVLFSFHTERTWNA
jgi:D-Tyr-tRNAtyr deacylase